MAIRWGIALIFCVMAEIGTAQSIQEKLNLIVEEIDALSTSKNATNEALRRLQTSIEVYLYELEAGESVPNGSAALQTAIAIIANGARDIAPDVESLRAAVDDYQDDFLISHIERLAESLNAALARYGATEYPHELLLSLIHI